MHRLPVRYAVCIAFTLALLSSGSAFAQSSGELRIAENQFIFSTDPDLSFGGYTLTAFGVSETLTRVTPDMQIVPWVASSVTPVDDLNWTVQIRDGVTFQDGSPADAAAIKASLERSLEKSAGATDLIPAGTTFNANGQTLQIHLPSPVGSMMYNLASYNFPLKKQTADGGWAFTGPYMFSYATDYVAQQSLTLHAYSGYWGGAPKLKTISIRYITDTSARVLALQAGDVDLAQALLPSNVPQLKSAGLQVNSFNFSRQDDMLLNVTRAPLDDVSVRRAISLGVDRDALVAGVMDGAATPAYAMVPSTLGFNGIVETQHFGVDEATQTLDAAGWSPGSDGIRTRGGQRLAFSLGFYASRPELQPLATAIKDQLSAIGMDVSLESVADINGTVADNNFDAVMWSYGVAPYGDPSYAVQTLFLRSSSNNNRYDNPRVAELFHQYNATSDPGARQDLLVQMQNTFGPDVPVVYVVNPNQQVGMSPRVGGYTPHPLENYKYDANLSLS